MTEMRSQAVRLSQTSIDTLTALSRKYFGDNAPVRLFGSRVNTEARGGDIDLQIIAPHATFEEELAFLVEIDQQLDERVDLRVQRNEKLLIDEIALNQGVLLNG